MENVRHAGTVIGNGFEIANYWDADRSVWFSRAEIGRLPAWAGGGPAKVICADHFTLEERLEWESKIAARAGVKA